MEFKSIDHNGQGKSDTHDGQKQKQSWETHSEGFSPDCVIEVTTQNWKEINEANIAVKLSDQNFSPFSLEFTKTDIDNDHRNTFN